MHGNNSADSRELPLTLTSRLIDLIPSTHSRRPLNSHSLLWVLLPPIACYYITAVLVLLPRTRFFRLALLPLNLWLAFRCITGLDLSLGYHSQRLHHLNQALAVVITAFSMRAMIWTFQLKPFRRVETLAEATPRFYRGKTISRLSSPRLIVIDAWDLCCNLRGIGWNYSCNPQVPPETRPTTSSVAFATATLVSLSLHLVAMDILHYIVQSFSPCTVGSGKGGTIFDSSLPSVDRYLRASLMSAFWSMAIYCIIQVTYHSSTLIGVLIFRQHPSLWPPIHDSPWLATSLTELWAKRWHQALRDIFISFSGGYSLPSAATGRVRRVLCAFLISGILHDVGIWSMGNGSESRNVQSFFVMNGLGVLLEHVWRSYSGSRVGGWSGRVWTIVWLVGWGNLLVDAWARKGLIGSRFIPQLLRPSTYAFGALPEC